MRPEDSTERRLHATSFDAVADAYERARPGYPLYAVRWLVGETPRDMLDLGAGTGKLTRLLAGLGHRVVAVEPLDGMREQLARAVPGVEALSGSAEAIPLPDDSVDVVTVAQAFHWFDHEPALREIARVLHPGGRLALVWNVRDDRHAWVAELSEAMVGRAGVDRDAIDPIDASGLFGPVEHVLFDHVQEIDRNALRELVLSRSYCAVLSEAERMPVFAQIDALFDTHAHYGVLALPYVTECFRAASCASDAATDNI